MNLHQHCRPEQLHLDDALFRCLYSFLEFGEDLDDMIFFEESYMISER